MTGAANELHDALDRLSDLRTERPDGCRLANGSLTREALLPALRPLGITRVGDLTGLDNLGVPVWAAIRPNSRSLCIANGKGMTEEVAWVSSVMESAEHALAETASHLVEVVASETDLSRRGHRTVPLARQSRCAAARLRADDERAWVRGIEWQTGEAIFAPYELIGLDLTVNAPWDRANFRMSSLGLGASGTMAAAIVHGLRELVEEDAAFGPLAGGLTTTEHDDVVRFRTGPANHLQDLVARLKEKDVEARFAVVQGDIDAPVAIAGLKPLQHAQSALTYFGGSACRDTTEDAALAALLEAIQSRLTFISGTRDDLEEDEYVRLLRSGTDKLLRGCIFEDTPLGSRREQHGPDTLERLITSVTSSGDRKLYIFPLGGRSLGFDVVRVLVDDLVTTQGPGDYPLGARAGGKLLRQWHVA